LVEPHRPCNGSPGSPEAFAVASPVINRDQAARKQMRSSWTARHDDDSMSTRAPHLCLHEQLIAALLLDVTAPRPTPRPISLPTLPAPNLPSTDDPDTLLVGTARVDRSGRIHERALLRALGWQPGYELELDTASDMIAIASVPGGRHRIDDRGALTLPAAARRSTPAGRQSCRRRRRPHSDPGTLRAVASERLPPRCAQV
jgi:hypothetical protein